MANDPCLDCCLTACCAVGVCCTADTVGSVAARDRTIGIVMGCILALGTILACTLLATAPQWCNSYSAYHYPSYVPMVGIVGGLLSLMAFAGAAAAGK